LRDVGDVDADDEVEKADFAFSAALFLTILWFQKFFCSRKTHVCMSRISCKFNQEANEKEQERIVSQGGEGNTRKSLSLLLSAVT
jgi:hypothetical protein